MSEKPIKPSKGDERFIVTYDQAPEMFKLGGVQTWVDKETGVNYLFVNTGSSGGLTPLLDAEGKLVVTPVY